MRATTSPWAPSAWMASRPPPAACPRSRCAPGGVGRPVQLADLADVLRSCANVAACGSRLLCADMHILAGAALGHLCPCTTLTAGSFPAAPLCQVRFDIDANGILSVTATDKGTGKKQVVGVGGACWAAGEPGLAAPGQGHLMHIRRAQLRMHCRSHCSEVMALGGSPAYLLPQHTPTN